MSYYILRKDFVIDLGDNVLYMSLGGCNNDNCGRTADDWQGKLYTRRDFLDEQAIDNFRI